MLRIVDAPDANLAPWSFLSHNFPATAGSGTVDGTNLVAAESHDFLLFLVEFGGLDSRVKQREDLARLRR
jgi:hypothetical protein